MRVGAFDYNRLVQSKLHAVCVVDPEIELKHVLDGLLWALACSLL